MEDFNSQYANHSKLEQLKQFILKHGTYIDSKRENNSLFRVK